MRRAISAVLMLAAGRVVKAPGSVQNLLAPFCCVLGEDTLRHFPLLSGLGKQF